MNCQECKEQMWPGNPEVGGYHIRLKRYFPPICQGCPQKDSPKETIIRLQERIANLEEISAQPGKIPRQYHDSLQQLQGQVVFLQNKVNEALDRVKKQPQETKITTKKLGVKID